MATTAGDEETVKYMLKRWQDPDSGLDDAWREEYMVFLSFPDEKTPNKVSVGVYRIIYRLLILILFYLPHIRFI